MLVYGATEENLREATEAANKRYAGNIVLEIRGRSGRAIRCGLRVKSSCGEGAHRSWSGRRTTSACWHAWRDVFLALYEARPNARCKTAMADYRGAESFARLFEMTGMRNLGSVVRPRQARECCECAGW